MNQVITILVAMVMLLGSFGEVAPSTGPVSLNANIEVMAEGKSVDEVASADADAMNKVLSFLNGLEFKIAVNNQIQQLNVQLNSKELLSFAMKKYENDLHVISSLAPHTEITISEDTLNSMKERMNNFKIDDQSMSKFTNMVKEKTEKLLNDFISKQGEAVNEKFEMFNKEYTEKRKIQTTTKEATLLFTEYMKDVFEDENLSSFIKQLNINLDTSELDEAYENFKKQDEEWFPAMDAEYYRNENNEDCIKIDVEKNDLEKAMLAILRNEKCKEIYINMNLVTGKTESTGTGTAGGLGLLQSFPQVSESSSSSETSTYNMDVHIVMDEENGNWAELVVYTDKGDIMVSFYSVPTDTGKDFRINAIIPSGEKSLSVSLNGKISNEDPVYNSKEDLNELALEELLKEINDSSSEKKNSKTEMFMNDVNGALNDLLQTLQQEAPDLMNILKTK